jgi:hypothetical protein
MQVFVLVMQVMKMGRFLPPLLFAIVLFSLGVEQGTAQTPPVPVVLPSGSKVEMALTRPVWAAKAKAGDPLYLQTIFPVTVGNRVAIPAGTYVAGTIDSIVKPTRKVNSAEIDVHFDQIIFADGYTVAIPDADQPGAPPAVADPGATLSMVTVQVSTNNDLLLDNGSQIEMTLEAPLALDAAKVALAAPLSRGPAPGQFKPATLCRPTPGTPPVPGTPATPDTVIPGTPSTTIPSGIDGVPDTVIPGTPPTTIPGTPGTPDDPGTPGTVCPAPPLVISSTPGGLSAPGGVVVKQTPTPAKKKTRLQDGKKGQS